MACFLVICLAAGGLAQEQSQTRESPPPPTTQDQSAPQPSPEPAQIPPASSIDAPSLAQVQERIAQVRADEGLTQADKDTILTSLTAALEALQRREAAQAERQRLADASASVPGTLAQLRAELDQPVSPPQLENFGQRSPDAALEAIRAQLADAEARQKAAQDELARLQADAEARQTRLNNAPALLVEWRDALAESTAELAALPADPADPAARARRWQSQAEASALAANIAHLEAEVASYTARREVLPLRVSLAQRRAETATRLIEQLRAAETEAANRKARQAQEQAQQQASQVSDPVLQRIAQNTSALAAKRLGKDGTIASLEEVRTRQAQATRQLTELQRRARNTAARVQAAGLTELVGRSLRDELRLLPEVDPEANERLSAAIGRAQYELIAIGEQLDDFRDVQAQIDRARARLTIGDEPLAPELERQISSIITSYVQTLQALESEYRSYYEEGLNLVATRNALAETTKAFRTFIEERILWTRSVQGSAIPSLDDAARGVVWLLGGTLEPNGTQTIVEERPIGSRWLETVVGLWPPPFLAFPVLLALAGSVWARRKAIALLKTTASQVRKFSTDRMSLTLKALPLTVLMALPLPIALSLAGIMLTGTDVGLARAVGSALFDAAVLAFVLEFVRHAARNDGLAEAHFRWRREGLTHFRRLVFLLEVSIIPVAIIVRAMGAQPDPGLNDSIGRMAFILAELLLAVFTAWVLAPWLPFVRNYLTKHPTGLANQARWVWYPLLVGAPISLAVLAAVGYYYTAAQLDARLQLTGWLVVAATIAYNLVLRWLFIERRKLLVKRAQQKRKAEEAEQTSGGGEIEGIEFETPAELDAAEVDTQTRRVLVAAVVVGVVLGLYALWAEQLPALRMLERVQLYPSLQFTPTESAQVVVPGLTEAPPREPQTQPQPAEGQSQTASDPGPLAALTPGSESASSSSKPLRAITLADVGGAFLFLALTWVLARNLPGLLEITILKRLPLDSGARFAFTSILRYFLVIIGVLLGFGAVGIGWSQVQFLAAALTFGLAFGLQEIFANFISGLIMLVERPVRVGDTVTVNNISGRVTRIRMRATTVLDWELREVIIPNKVFITDQFTNWTLSDPRIRVSIPVGVSYGSDVRLVERTLLEIGQSQPHVVTEPRVRSLFMGFGDSTLNFELRVYLENFDYFLEAKSTLHTRIAERFRELDIEIAFPQRDLNIRDIGPLAQALAQSKAGRDLPPTDAAGSGSDTGS